MGKLTKSYPELEKWNREKWSGHPNWHRRALMPQYHVHFREESQEVIAKLLEFYKVVSEKRGGESVRADLQHAKSVLTTAYRQFKSSMRTLEFHVSIEEHRFFPACKQSFPEFDVSILYTQHEELHSAEKEAMDVMESVIERCGGRGDSVDTRDALLVIERFLAFDSALINHLGEEEDIVTPMGLVSPFPIL